MATYNIDKITSPSGDVYKLQDKVSGFTTNTGTVTQVTAGTGLKIGTATSGGSITTTGTINHINSISAGTVGDSSATSGKAIIIPYITYDAQGHITATGTHTHTVSGFITNLVNGSATGSVRGINTASESDTYTIGRYAFVEGNGTAASGTNSHAEGSWTSASGSASHAEGNNTTASGSNSHAEGSNTTASGDNSHAEGNHTTASGSYSHAGGFYTTASNAYCSAEGYYATASGFCSYAKGYHTTASGYYTYANGYYTVAQRESQTVIGKYNILDTEGSDGHDYGDYVFIIGNGTADDARSNALAVDWNGNIRIAGDLQDMSGNSLISGGGGLSNLKDGSQSGSVRGINTSTEDTNYTIGTNAMAVGYNTRAIGEASFAEGYVVSYEEEVPGGTIELSVTVNSVIENYNDTGYLTVTFSDTQYSLADLSVGDTIRTPSGSNHPWAIETIDLTNNRISISEEGRSDFNWSRDKSAVITTTQAPETVQLEFGAIGDASHAEGCQTLASGHCSHAEGNSTMALGRGSHAGGWGTIAASARQTVIGAYNIADENDNYYFIVGNGTSNSARSNAFGVLQDGNTVQFVDVTKGTTPTAQKYSEIRFKQKSGTLANATTTLAKFGMSAETDGSYKTYIRGYYPIANNSNSCNITITTRPNGNNWIDLESWVNVLGGHLDICSPSSGVLGFRYGGAASATATITNTSGSTLATNGNFNIGGNLTATGGVLTGNLVVGQLADTVDRNVTVRNSLGIVAINVSSAGNHGLYSSTKGGWIIYCNPDANSTNSLAYIPRPLNISGLTSINNNVIATASDTGERYFRAVNSNGSIELNASAGNKGVYDRSGGRWIMYLATNSTADTAVIIPRGLQVGEAGINGYIELYHATPYIDFHFGRSTADYTTRLWESASGTLTCSGFFQAKLFHGGVAQVVGSVNTAKQQVSYFATNATAFYIYAQHGATTFSNKSIAFSSSDIRLKTNIVDSTVNALDVINKIRIREFDWTDEREEKHQVIGIVADEIEKLDKKFAVGGGYTEDGDMNIKSVDTFYLTGYLTKGMQELSGKVDSHDDKIAALEKENEELREEIEELKKEIA